MNKRSTHRSKSEDMTKGGKRLQQKVVKEYAVVRKCSWSEEEEKVEEEEGVSDRLS